MSVTTSFTITDSRDLANAIVAIDRTGADAKPDTSYTFTFDLSHGSGTLKLAAQLDAINLDAGSSLTIQGSGDTLDGAGSYRGLFVYAGTVTVDDLTIADTSARGGNGGKGVGLGGGGGGGGAGLGGGLLVASGGSVTLFDVGFTGDSAVGGNGGSVHPVSGNSSGGGGGGGGLGGNGGSGNAGDGPGGGGGVGGRGGTSRGAGGAGLIPGAGSGGHGSGGGQGGPSGGGGGAGSHGGGGGVDGKATAGFAAGQGGFGGGGGGGLFTGGATGFSGGGGGLGGGGGGGLYGGKGGFGGGGGGGIPSTLGGVRTGIGGFGGGDGGNGFGNEGIATVGGGGGGGLGAGGDIFVQQGGVLAIEGGTLGAGSVSGGSGGAGYGHSTAGGNGEAFGSGLFIQGNESVTLDPSSSTTLTVNGVIADQSGSGGTGPNAGAGTLVIGSRSGGGGTVVLDATNTYAGQTVLQSGTLELAAAGAAGSSAILFSGDPVLTVTNADLSGSGKTLSFANTIDTFNTASTIDLPGLSYDPNGTTTLDAGSPSTLEVVANGTTVDFAFAGSIDFAGLHFHLTPDAGTGTLVTENTTPCFLRGTLILTPSGEVPVETLRPGDLVRTASGAARSLRWVGFGRTVVTPRNRDRAAPVVVRRHALAEGVPHRDLYITRGHALYLEGVLIPVEELINYRSIAWVEEARVVEFYHLELDSHDVVIAERAATESYREDGNSPLFHNVKTRPATSPMPPYAPVLHEHPTVKRIWRKLSDRAGRLELSFTDDPDLHLCADGVRLDAENVADGVWQFRLSGAAAELRIVSRSAIPSMIGLDQDQRRLGVALRRIVLRLAGLTVDLAWDEPRLASGFHNAEPGQQHRWTDGEAVLPRELLAPFGAGTDVALHVTGLLPYPLPTPSFARAA